MYHNNSIPIETPSYPNNYLDNAECDWEIIAPNGYTVLLHFIGRFHLENSSNCENDFVEVYMNILNIVNNKNRVCITNFHDSYIFTHRILLKPTKLIKHYQPDQIRWNACILFPSKEEFDIWNSIQSSDS